MTIEGSFENGVATGVGQMQCQNEKGEIVSFYKGEFRGDHPHGAGEQRTISGDLYEGSFVRGKKGPQGKWTFAD